MLYSIYIPHFGSNIKYFIVTLFLGAPFFKRQGKEKNNREIYKSVSVYPTPTLSEIAACQLDSWRLVKFN